MKQRILTGVVALLILGIIFAVKNTYIFAFAIGLISIVAMNELYSSFDNTCNKIDRNYRVFAFIFVVTLYLLECVLNNNATIFVVFIFSFVIIAYGMIKYNDKSLNNISIVILSMLYIAVPLWCLYAIYSDYSTSILVGYIFIIAFGADTFAYFAGVFFGKKKIVPVLSPNKTLAGFIGGILGCIALVFLYNVIISSFIDIDFSLIGVCKYTAFAVIGAFISQIGDLFASAIKRKNGIKDYSNLMPGHGGMLDRFDSILMVAPYVYFMINLL